MHKLRQFFVLTVVLYTTCSANAQVKGSGTTDYVPLWQNSGTIENSIIYQSGGHIGISTTSPLYALDVNGRINTSDWYMIGGTNFISQPGGITYQNTAVGASAMNTTVTGNGNSAFGFNALTYISSGVGNVAVGSSALQDNTSGGLNTAVGGNALLPIQTGALNIGIGFDAGANLPMGANNNILIGSLGSGSDSGAIRIGRPGYQTSFYVTGVSGTSTGAPDAVPVLIDTNGQMGTMNSSRRYKEDIQDMGDATLGLMQLRPVTFRYQKAFNDGSKPLQYGLIAEEVEEVYPELIAHSADGQIQSVKYQMLDSMLLNEVQRQRTEIEQLQEKLAKMETALAAVAQKADKPNAPVADQQQ